MMRNVFLFGAGAAMEWQAPTTKNITNIIRQAGFKVMGGNETITEYIFQRLQSNGFNNINFETIINVLEELVVYYSDFDSHNDIPSLGAVFLDPKNIEPLLNFSISGGIRKHGYTLEIPKRFPYHFSRFAHDNEKPEQFFFQHLINELLSTICAELTKYCAHSPDHSTILQPSNEEINRLFVEWMQKQSAERTLKMYTLNYDRIPKILLERVGLSVFEGFDCGEYPPHRSRLRANVPKILTDDVSHLHYNLHGSIFWELASLDDHSLPNPELMLTKYPTLPINFEQSTVQIEKGKTLLVSNIITGYQKSQKAILSPFRQMQAAFDKDCCLADTIYIIGYSFGDEHINASLKSAIRFNRKLKVIIVDPYFISNDMDYQFFIKLFPYRDDLQANSNPKKIGQNLYSYFNGDFLVHTLTFKEFLQLIANQKNQAYSFNKGLRMT